MTGALRHNQEDQTIWSSPSTSILPGHAFASCQFQCLHPQTLERMLWECMALQFVHARLVNLCHKSNSLITKRNIRYSCLKGTEFGLIQDKKHTPVHLPRTSSTEVHSSGWSLSWSWHSIAKGSAMRRNGHCSIPWLITYHQAFFCVCIYELDLDHCHKVSTDAFKITYDLFV